ncbi:alpha/beta fold hydrolase [Streptomyces sp. B1866]|uniref:alpha/beta fold hydrolase n=1 Tax=Streptomyces sp. B1866 TaxID=3075431 RepID=UPI00288E0B4A|nr:alpha/beta fold hydrolase [Streptomyces sp. B1866]MDT3399499.1 alpha/beta fold hydrolase [Streptomyces sp. B1866]
MTHGTEAGYTPSCVPLVTIRTRRAALLTDDGVSVDAIYESYAGPAREAEPPSAVVIAHGFTGSWQRPAVRRVAAALRAHAAVISFSLRGHGASGGLSTVGDREVLDVAAAVRWARLLGHARVATVGFSLGGAVVLRHAALCREPGHPLVSDAPEGAPPSGGDIAHDENGPRGAADRSSRALAAPGRTPGAGVHARGTQAHTDAVVAVSAPARWHYRGTPPMRRVHWAIDRPEGRLVARYGLRTRVDPHRWNPVPLAPFAAVPLIAPTPLLVVHGDRDPYFPLDHPRMLAAAGDPSSTDLWIEPGVGHAENAMDAGLLERIGAWAARAAAGG